MIFQMDIYSIYEMPGLMFDYYYYYYNSNILIITRMIIITMIIILIITIILIMIMFENIVLVELCWTQRNTGLLLW